MEKDLICFAVIILCIVPFSCNEEIDDQDIFIVVNPIDSINSFFAQAEGIAGEGIYLSSISGVQLDAKPNLSCNMNWTLTFVKDKRIITFNIIQGKTKVSDKTTQELPLGDEHIYINDERLESILSPEVIWDSCIQKYNKEILKIEVSAPLLAQKSNFIYRLYSKEGYNRLGVDYFIFDGKSGDDLTNQQ